MPAGTNWSITYLSLNDREFKSPASRNVCAVRWFLAIMDSGSVAEALRMHLHLVPPDPREIRQRVYGLLTNTDTDRLEVIATINFAARRRQMEVEAEAEAAQAGAEAEAAQEAGAEAGAGAEAEAVAAAEAGAGAVVGADADGEPLL